MHTVRPAAFSDAGRISEIEVFNYRLNFYPIFRCDEFYFGEYTVDALRENYHKNPSLLKNTYVFDDGCVKGFVRITGGEIEKLFVEPVLQGRGIGACLLEFAITQKNARMLWTLQKNTRAIAFYEKHGFTKTSVTKPEADTEELLILLERK